MLLKHLSEKGKFFDDPGILFWGILFLLFTFPLLGVFSIVLVILWCIGEGIYLICHRLGGRRVQVPVCPPVPKTEKPRPEPPPKPTRAELMERIERLFLEDMELAARIADPTYRQYAEAAAQMKRRQRLMELING